MKFEKRLLATWPIARWSQRRILLAVSGGADSMAMLHAFRRLAPNPELLEVAHFNHQWRGEASDGDEYFVVDAAKRVGLTLHLGRSRDAYGDTQQKSEQSARQMRYQFLADKAYQTGARYVVTAHTSSDQVETVLHNLFRGTGIAGLRGIEKFRSLDDELVLARPLIELSREDVLQYLELINERFREDASNQDRTYKRNFIRHELLPMLRTQFNEKLDARLLQLSRRFDDVEKLLIRQANEYFETVEGLIAQAGGSEFDERLTVNAIAFPKKIQLDGDWLVIQTGLNRLWQERSWPLSGMSHQKWQVIEDCWLDKSPAGNLGWKTVENLPGELLLRSNHAWVTIQPSRIPEV